MPGKYPFEYEITPRRVGEGTRWIEVELKNVGTDDMENIEVRLNSLDDYGIDVNENSKFVDALDVGESTTIPFQLNVRRRGAVYISVDGWIEDTRLHWESPDIQLVTGQEMAEITRFFALSEPYAALGKPVTCEATVESLTGTDNMVLEFWVERPDGEMLSIEKTGTGTMAAGEVESFNGRFTAEQEGIYTLHVYLYAGDARIERLDYAVDHLSVGI